jgi:undecaprenyl diphosphate synthase
MEPANASLNPENIPQHIAVIMDGNGRWAQKQGAERLFGHRNAITAVRDTAEGCAELGVKFLTLYAFSTENWGRPKQELDGLMELLVHTISAEIGTLNKNNIRLATIGNTAGLPGTCQAELQAAIAETSVNTGMTLTLALNYSGRWDILTTTQKLMQLATKGEIQASDLTEEVFSQHLQTSFMPDPELLIRTSGEFRISNFLLWEMAYTEIHITEVLWPDFNKVELYEAITDYQQRDRRFGKVNSNTSNS